MNNFCGNCGKEITGDTKFCGNCGAPVNQVQQPVYNQPQYNQYEQVKPNNGSTAGMVLGIIAAAWALLSLLAVDQIKPEIIKLTYEYGSFTVPMAIGFSIGYNLLSFILGCIGLPISISALKKQKTNKNIAGVALNGSALAIALIITIYILTLV